MNPNLMQLKYETEVMLLCITKNCQKLLEQIHTKPQEILEFKLTQQSQTFHFNPSIQTEGSWLTTGLTSLEV